MHARSVEVTSETSSYVHDRRAGQREEIVATTPGPLSRHELDDLYDQTLVEAADSDAVVLAGPLPGAEFPVDVYRRLLVDLRQLRTPAVADLSGDALGAALAGGLPVLKVSDEELAQRYPPAEGCVETHDSEEWVARAIGFLLADGARDVVVSRGPRPTIAWVDGAAFELQSPRFATVDSRGGGDSMTAVIALSTALRTPWPETLRLAGAAGSLNVTRRGLASTRGEDVRRLADRCAVRELTGLLWAAEPPT